MLTLSSTNTHYRRGLSHHPSYIVFWGLVSWVMCSAVNAQPETLPVGDERAGYEHADYESRSARLGPVAGERLSLVELTASPPLGLPALTFLNAPIKRPGPPPSAEVDLGRRLFFDRRLSANGTLSCGMCHIPEQGFTQNELATPVGIEGRSVRRNAPSLYNVAYVQDLFHDGREPLLSKQIWEPLLAENEMGNRSPAAVLARLRQVDDYASQFAALYTDGLTEQSLGYALAAYQSGLLSADARFDRWLFGGDATSLSEQEERGFALFKTRGCSTCHFVGTDDALFTNGAFYNTGIGHRAASIRRQPAQVQLAPGVFVRPAIPIEVPRLADEGRFEVTAASLDRYRYRTPSLRNVALTAPYMHDGSLATLEEVIEYYNGGGGTDPAQDPRIRPLGLSGGDKAALASFLRTLTGSNVNALAADARSVAIGERGAD